MGGALRRLESHQRRLLASIRGLSLQEQRRASSSPEDVVSMPLHRGSPNLATAKGRRVVAQLLAETYVGPGLQLLKSNDHSPCLNPRERPLRSRGSS